MKKRNRQLLLQVGIFLVGAITFICLLSFVWIPHDPESMNTALRFQTPDATYWLGTDQFGRDIFSRLMISSRYALLVGLGSVTAGASIGIIIGALVAFSNQKVQTFVMRMVDGMMAFPGILLALMLVTVLGKGFFNSLLAIAIFMIPSYTRLTYSMVLGQKDRLYIKAAKTYGASNVTIIFKHIFPAILPRLVTNYTASIGGAILLESSLSFLGLGVQAPQSSWGLMLSESRQFTLTQSYLAFPPGIMLLLTVLGFNLMGDALNDYLISRGDRM